MIHKILISALRVLEQPVFKLIQHLDIIGRFSCVQEARLQLQNLLHLQFMLLLVRSVAPL